MTDLVVPEEEGAGDEGLDVGKQSLCDDDGCKAAFSSTRHRRLLHILFGVATLDERSGSTDGLDKLWIYRKGMSPVCSPDGEGRAEEKNADEERVGVEDASRTRSWIYLYSAAQAPVRPWSVRIDRWRVQPWGLKGLYRGDGLTEYVVVRPDRSRRSGCIHDCLALRRRRRGTGRRGSRREAS